MSDIHIRINRRVPKPQQRPTRLSALLLWAIAAAGLIAASLFSPVLTSVLQDLNPHLQLLITNLLYYLPFVALPVFLLAKRRPGLYEAYRPNPISLFNVISIVILAVLGVFFANDIIILWAIPFQELGFNVFSASLPVASTTGELMLSVITVAVIPAVCEEFLFRGAVLSAFEGEGTKHAMWASSLLFMLIHGSLVGMPTQLILGMILSSLVIWSDSIYAGLIYHTVHNATAVLLDFINSRTLTADTTQTNNLLETIGGGAGIASLALSILITGAMIYFSLKMFRLRGRLMGVTPDALRKKPLRPAEWALFICGFILCAVLYAMDIVLMLGG